MSIRIRYMYVIWVHFSTHRHTIRTEILSIADRRRRRVSANVVKGGCMQRDRLSIPAPHSVDVSLVFTQQRRR